MERAEVNVKFTVTEEVGLMSIEVDGIEIIKNLSPEAIEKYANVSAELVFTAMMTMLGMK